MTDWVWESATSCATAIREGTLSSRELVEACWERIDQVNPRLNALIAERREASLADAREADRMLAREQSVGPLCGVPMSLKDSFDCSVLPATWGTRGRVGFVPSRDATAVSRVRSAGAIVLGKTNTPELTLSFHTANRVFGATANPYSLEHTPGGSSGGSAALVAAGGSCFDLGTDTGGSIRLPAHFCGVAGLRPTSGRVPRTGHAIGPCGPIEALTQVGPIARRVEDLDLILGLIAGPDGSDLAIPPVPWQTARLEDASGAALRVQFHVDNGVCPASAEIARVVRESARVLADRGVHVDEGRPVGIARAASLFPRLMLYDGGEWVHRLLESCGTALDESPLRHFYSQLPASGQELLECFDDWEQYRREMSAVWKHADALLCPVNAQVAATLEQPEHSFEAYSYTMAFNLTGWPAVVVRAGCSQAGLPIGVQIVAPPWREDLCLHLARWIEESLGGYVPPTL